MSPNGAIGLSAQEYAQQNTLKQRFLTLAGNAVNTPVATGLTSVVVTWASPEASDLNYGVNATPNWVTTWAVTNKTLTSATITFGTAAPANATIDVSTFRQTSAPSAPSVPPVFSAVDLVPSAVTINTIGGTSPLTGTTRDQFNNGILVPGTVLGGRATWTSAGYLATAASEPAVQALATAFVWKGVLRADALNAVASGSNYTLLNVSGGQGNSGTNKKIECYYRNSGGVNAQFYVNIPALSIDSTAVLSIPIAKIPANGNDIRIYYCYDNAVPKTTVTLFDSSGNVIATGSLTAGMGALPVATGNGWISCGWGPSGTKEASNWDGFAIYSAALPVNEQFTPPAVTDANLIYMCLMNDATSGTTPTTSTPQVGTQALNAVGTTITWAGSGYNSGVPGTPILYGSQNQAVATIDSTGKVTSVGTGTTTVYGWVGQFTAATTVTVASALSAQYGSHSDMFFFGDPPGSNPYRAAQVADISAMKLQFHRSSCRWDKIQPGGPGTAFDWSSPDNAVLQSNAAGVKLMVYLGGSPKSVVGGSTNVWYVPTGGSRAAWVAAQATWMAAAVTHLAPQGVVLYEIWNEWNQSYSGSYWMPNGSIALPAAADYAALVGACYPAMKAAAAALSPPVAIQVAWTAGTNLNMNDGNSNCFPGISAATALMGLGVVADAISCHPYATDGSPDPSVDNYPGGNSFKDIGRMQAAMVANGYGSYPLWVTEYGEWSGDKTPATGGPNDTTRAGYLTSALGLLEGTYSVHVVGSSAAGVTYSCVFANNNGQSGGVDTSPYYGLYTGSPLAGPHLQTLTAAAYLTFMNSGPT